MAKSKVTPIKKLSEEVGAIGVQSWGGRIQQDDPNFSLTPEQWRGDMGQPGDAESMMRQDPMIKAADEATAAPIIQASWSVVAGSAKIPEGATDEQKERHDQEAELLREYVEWGLFTRPQGTWKAFISSATSYRGVGFWLGEQVWKRDTWNGRPVICLAKIAERRQRTVDSWVLADSGEVDAVNHWKVTQDDQQIVSIPGDKLVHFVKGGHGSPEGVGLRRPIHFPWRMRQMFMKSAGIMVERTAAPWIRAKYTDQTPKSDVDQLRKMAREFRNHERQSATYHESVTFEWGEAADPRAIEFAMNASELMALEIARAYGALHLMTGSEGKGALSLDQSRKSTAAMMIEGDAEYMADVLNRGDNAIVPRLVHFNWAPEEFVFGEIPMPVLTVSNIREPDMGALVEAFTKAADAGLLTPDKEARDATRLLLGLNPEPVLQTDDADESGRIPDPIELNEHIARMARDGLIVADTELENFLRKRHGLPERAADAPPPGDPKRREAVDGEPPPDNSGGPSGGGKPKASADPLPDTKPTSGDESKPVEPQDKPPEEEGTDGGGQGLSQDSVPFAQAAKVCGCSDCVQALAHLTDNQRTKLQAGKAMSGRTLRLEEQCLDLEGMADSKQEAADQMVARSTEVLQEQLQEWVEQVRPLIQAGDVEAVAEFPPPELDFTEAVAEPLAGVTEAGKAAVEDERRRQRGDPVPEPPDPIEFPEEAEVPEGVEAPIALADGDLDPDDLDPAAFARAQAAKLRRRMEADINQTATSMTEQSLLGGEVAEAEELTEALIAQAQGGIKEIARAGIGAAFGQGRAAGIEDFRVEQEAAGLEAIVVYSNAAESAVCAVCEGPDGEVFVVGSAEYAAVFPPNPQCESTASGENRCNCNVIAAEAEVRGEITRRANERRVERGQETV